MSDTKAPRRTQAQRREESSQAVLDSAKQGQWLEIPA